MRKYIFHVFILFLSCGVFAQQKELHLSMQDAIDYALKNNYDNKIAAKNIEAAKERKWETTTIGLPQIDGKVDYQNWLKQQVQLLPAELAGGAPGTFVPVRFGTSKP